MGPGLQSTAQVRRGSTAPFPAYLPVMQAVQVGDEWLVFILAPGDCFECQDCLAQQLLVLHL